MNNQTQNLGAEPRLQPVILQSVCNPAAKGNVSINATKCLGNIGSNISVWFYNILAWILFHSKFKKQKIYMNLCILTW